MIVPERRAALELMPLRTGLAVLDVLSGLHDLEDVGLKWPNDLWWQDRKVGGILCEKQGGGAVVGIGINLVRPSGVAFDVAPVGLEDLVPGGVSRSRLLGALVQRIRTTLEQGGPRLSAAELDRLASRDRLRNRVVRCTDGPGGIARGIGPDGGLRVETEEGERSVRTGSVRPVGRIRESGGATR
jgi:BirA family biotin operon repressor/biotin-[acetyl-CoA-carboxylase] ligase